MGQPAVLVHLRTRSEMVVWDGLAICHSRFRHGYEPTGAGHLNALPDLHDLVCTTQF